MIKLYDDRLILEYFDGDVLANCVEVSVCTICHSLCIFLIHHEIGNIHSHCSEFEYFQQIAKVP